MDVLTVDVPGIFTEHGKGSVPVGFQGVGNAQSHGCHLCEQGL